MLFAALNTPLFFCGTVSGEDIRITPVVKAVQETKAAVVNVSTYEKVKERANPFSGYSGDPYFERFFDNFMEPRYEKQISSNKPRVRSDNR